MSWFTAPTNSPVPACERCKMAGFVVLIKRGPNVDIYDCKRCGSVEKKAKSQ